METRVNHTRIWLSFFVGVVILVAAALPAIVHSAAAVQTLRNLPAEWLLMSSPARQDFIKFLDDFPVTDIVLASWPTCRLGDPSLDETRALLEPLCSETSSDIRSSAPTETAKAFHALVGELYGSTEPFHWVRTGEQLTEFLQSPPISLSKRAAQKRLANSFLGPEGQQTCIVVSLKSGPKTRLLIPQLRAAIATEVGLPVEEIAFVGGAVDGAEIDSESIASIEKYSPWTSLVAATICLFCLRSIWLSATVIAIASIGQGMVLAIVYYSGVDMNAVLIVLPPLVFVLTTSSGIHLSNYYLDLIRQPCITPGEAVTQAMRMGTLPCLMATGTTVIGLTSLLLVRLSPVRAFGLLASVGILGTLVLMLLVLPGSMLIHGRLKRNFFERKLKSPKPIKAWRLGSYLISRFPWAIVLASTTLIGSAAVGLGWLRTSVSVPKMFKPDSDFNKQYRWFESNVGATMTCDYLLTFLETDDVDPLDQMRVVMRLHSDLNDVEGVGSVLSGPTFLKIPRNTLQRIVIRALIKDPKSRFNQLGYVSGDETRRTWRVSLRLFQSQDTEFAEIIDRINAAANASKMPDGQPISELFSSGVLTGHAVIVNHSQSVLLEDLFKSFLFAFVVILVIMSISLRSVLGGLLTMVPNTAPTIVLFGLMGWMELPLDIGAVMTASVALGIAVDDTVHLLSRYRYHLPKHGERNAALAALRQCGPAMLQTTVVCSLSLLVYGLSQFVPTQRFAIFMFALLSVALLSVTALLGSIMSTRLGRFLKA